MNPSTLKTKTAFQKLIAALDGEIAELNRLNGQILHKTSPVQVRELLLRARRITRLRDCLGKLHAQWAAEAPIVLHEPPLESLPRRLLLLLAARRIKGFSIRTTAKKLGMSELQVTCAVEERMLKAVWDKRGRPRIPVAELLQFAHRNCRRIAESFNVLEN
jgi:hypothetical protein